MNACVCRQETGLKGRNSEVVAAHLPWFYYLVLYEHPGNYLENITHD